MTFKDEKQSIEVIKVKLSDVRIKHIQSGKY